MIEDDALQARLIAVQCWDAETLRGPEWQALPSNDGINLPRGLAHQGRYALHLLEKFDGDLDRLMATAAYCRRAAQEQGRERQARWMRAADLCEQAVARVTNHAGDDPDLQRAMVHRLLNPEPEPQLKESLVYRIVWVARLPDPHHLSKAPCLRVLTNTDRWARQMRPTRTARVLPLPRR
ncbi:hypothetical protein [Nocardiopsis eucommiae]|uniref:hypothetical protein n=1 Tax=Nocardiopsis eucommiae TaxID=2831970 RepID=UPI003D7493D0